MTELRSLARSTGILRPLNRARSIVHRFARQQSYEAKFDRALMQAIRPGDCVWDVGANLGLYTTRFSDAVGQAGCVMAFEPTPECFAGLTQATAERGHVKRFQLALGAAPSIAAMSLSDNLLGATHSLAVEVGPQTIQVEVARGDDLVASGRAAAPNVIKIDVEGFELEVIEGLTDNIARPSCRAVLCEVHFGLLEQRGQRQTPARIVELLQRLGYRTSWVDVSHLAALRPSTRQEPS
jgi:FkbM family methyltransferase